MGPTSGKITMLMLGRLIALALGLGQLAFADALMITSGALTATINDNGSCTGSACASLSGDLNPATGQISVLGSINGWTINSTANDSRVNNELENVIDAQCTLAAGCTGANSLDVQFSGTDFIPTTGQFSIYYSDAQTGTGSTVESAYIDAANGLFAETDLLGTVGPFALDSSNDVDGIDIVIKKKTHFAEDLDMDFAGSDGTSFSVSGSMAETPEPGSIVLLISVVAMFLFGFRRTTKSRT